MRRLVCKKLHFCITPQKGKTCISRKSKKFSTCTRRYTYIISNKIVEGISTRKPNTSCKTRIFVLSILFTVYIQ